MTALAASAACERRNTAKLHRAASWRDFVLFSQRRVTPAQLAPRAARVRALASVFDGLCVTFPTGLTNCLNPTAAINTTTLANEVTEWNNIDRGNMTKNWAFNLSWYDAPAPLIWNDSYWSQMAANYAAYANVIKTAEDIKGIFWDCEFYSAGIQTPYYLQWPEGSPDGQTLAASLDKARARGKQLMDAIQGVWPDVTLLTVFGPSHSYEGTAHYVGGNTATWAHNDLMGSLLFGLQESCQAAGSRAVWIDGGEYYRIRSNQDAWKFAWWEEIGSIIRQPVNGGNIGPEPIVPPSLVPEFRTPCAQSVYDLDAVVQWPNATNTQLTDWTNWAMRGTRSMVWLYSEVYDFFEGLHGDKTLVTQATLDALTEGRRRGRL